MKDRAFRRWPTMGRMTVVTGAGLGVALVAAGAAIFLAFGPVGRGGAADICIPPGPPPALHSETPPWNPEEGGPPPLSPGAVQLPPFNPSRGDALPELPDGWFWEEGKPVPESGLGGASFSVRADGTTNITLFPAEDAFTWEDPDSLSLPPGVSLYDPDTDLCRDYGGPRG